MVAHIKTVHKISTKYSCCARLEASAFQGWKRSGLCLTSLSNGLAVAVTRWCQAMVIPISRQQHGIYRGRSVWCMRYHQKSKSSRSVSWGLHSDGFGRSFVWNQNFTPLCWRRKCDVSWFRSHFSKLMFEAKVRGEKHQCNSLRFSSLNQGSLVFTAGLSCQNPRSLAQSDLGFHTCDLRGIFMSVPYRSTPSRHLHALYL